MSDFKGLREQGVYVDKTDMLYRLVERAGCCYANIISRPDGFGKSTMLSTLRYIYEGRRELFKGLAIDREDYDWKPWPIIFMDMADAVGETVEEVEAKLLEVVRKAVGEDLWGDDDYTSTYASGAFMHALFALKRREQCAVILIDNFDAPIRAVLDRPKLAEEIVRLLNNVYIHLKCDCASIHFLLMAGEMPYATLLTSVFSGVNNLDNISLETPYLTLCGFTGEELERYFGPQLHAHAEKMGLPYAVYRRELDRWIGGYRFDYDSDPLVNPLYLKRVLEAQAETFDDRWVPACRSVLLKFAAETDHRETERARRWKEDPERDYGKTDYADGRDLYQWCCDPERFSTLGLLFRAGYFTVLKAYEPEMALRHVGIPNEAVRRDLRRLGLKVSEPSDIEKLEETQD